MLPKPSYLYSGHSHTICQTNPYLIFRIAISGAEYVFSSLCLHRNIYIFWGCFFVMVYQFLLAFFLELGSIRKPYLLLSLVMEFLIISCLTERLLLKGFHLLTFVSYTLGLIKVLFMLDFPLPFLIPEANHGNSFLVIFVILITRLRDINNPNQDCLVTIYFLFL
jgi:hypothetical protein